MGFLRITKVNYQGNIYQYESPDLDQDIVMIEGDNGTGKTTFCNLIYFALGGRVSEFIRDEKETHKEITGDRDNFVELFLNLNGENFQTIRFIGDNDVTITPYNCSEVTLPDGTTKTHYHYDSQNLRILPVNRTAHTPETYSDWLLGKLGISVVDIQQGISSFKINAYDIFRLIYVDQQSDTKQIYKKIDKQDNYVSDSSTLRRAIFELLVGKSFSDYYKAIINSKTLERQKNVASGLLREYKRLAEELGDGDTPKNKSFLVTDLNLKEEQLNKLHDTRSRFKRNRSSDSAIESAITSTKSAMMSAQIILSEKKETLTNLLEERQKLALIRESAKKEIDQITKIIHSHDQLNLFSSDSCPYCLAKVDRVSGHCVCGSEIDEEQYERFSYTSLEYKNILKSKIKSLDTIDLAITDCNSEITGIRIDVRNSENTIPVLTEKLRSQISNIDEHVDLETINTIDDKILDLREDISRLHQLIAIESKLEIFQSDFDTKRTEFQKSELALKGLDAQTKLDIRNKVDEFSIIYKKLMTETLAECRTARISPDTYLPVLDEGEYKEHSSSVSTRLMYYLTLLQMSLDDPDVPFPRFLLIDTPETAGIELDKLKICLKKIEEIKEKSKIQFQVILTTGLGKYPEEFKPYRKIYMPTKADALLKRK